MKCVPVHHGIPAVLHRDEPWLHRHSENGALSGHLKINKTKVLMENGSLKKVESIAECSLGEFCNIFDMHLAIIGLEKPILVFF